MDAILVVNAGSSSVKFQVFKAGGSQLERLIKGQISGIGTSPRLRAEDGGGKSLADHNFGSSEIADVAAALSAAGEWLRERSPLLGESR